MASIHATWYDTYFDLLRCDESSIASSFSVDTFLYVFIFISLSYLVDDYSISASSRCEWWIHTINSFDLGYTKHINSSDIHYINLVTCTWLSSSFNYDWSYMVTCSNDFIL